ncbi:hypothetical protein KHO57_gp240 [Mycobacterium phage Phabba]|uniref:Uncharacterized protein n=1 Tax=Mycobacterium phage Phabba TaxID=2027899 RepID=A0A249XTY2_9CAUD|nr:hypothetical protein KHO57_gp240 [Mycobacterium phage Phabba]ASZ74664.1 hypothetical protein SEA_PHABBA_95 [Mycobacterium phage Phabba]
MPAPYQHPAPEFREETSQEYGIRLPNGQEVWPPELYMGKVGYQEEAERAIIASAVNDGVINMGLPDAEIGRFSWLIRTKRTLTTVVRDEDIQQRSIDNPDVTGQSRYSETGTQDPE